MTRRAPEQLEIGLPGLAKANPRGCPESPGESRLLAAFLASGAFQRARCPSELIAATSALGHLLTQVPVVVGGARYRLDFAVVSPCGRLWLAVEIDGHEAHTGREQVRRDRQRERALTAAGWRVLRFTGSEVANDAAACVGEVVGMLQAVRATAKRREAGDAA